MDVFCPRRRLAASVALAGACLLATPLAAAPAGWQHLELTGGETYALRYLPPAVDTTRPLPVIVFLHGTGSYPEQWRPHLEAPADAAGAVLLVPRADHYLGFGPGDDLPAIREGLDRLRAELPIDEARIAVAGHSSGAAYAAVAAFAPGAPRFSAVFALGSPYRIVLAPGDPLLRPPVRQYYGSQDPNYQGGSWAAWRAQWERLGVDWELELGQGHGHNDWPATTLADGFRFLVSSALATPGGCVPSDRRLCLLGGRFAVELTWGAEATPGRVAGPGADRAGLFYLANERNLDVQVRLGDHCRSHGRVSVHVTGTSREDYTVTVTEVATGHERAFHHPAGKFSPAILSTDAFACGAGP